MKPSPAVRMFMTGLLALAPCAAAAEPAEGWDRVPPPLRRLEAEPGRPQRVGIPLRELGAPRRAPRLRTKGDLRVAPGSDTQVTVVLALVSSDERPDRVRVGFSSLHEHAWVTPEVRPSAPAPPARVERAEVTSKGVRVEGLPVCGENHGPVAAVVHYALRAAPTEDPLAGLTVEPEEGEPEPPALCLLRGYASGAAPSAGEGAGELHGDR